MARVVPVPLAMRVAIPEWQGRTSPVLDVAGNLLLIDIETGRETRREERQLVRTDPIARAAEISNLGADILICGAISAPLEARLASSGLQVIGFICGSVDDVLAAFLDGKLARPIFRMPGCGGFRRHMRQGGNGMQAGFGVPRGGCGQGRGQVGGGGRRGGSFAAGPGGSCVCPSCGERVPHASGQPCNQMVCPKCGAKMTRT